MVGVCWDVQHVFNPVSAVGNLHVYPTGFVIAPSAMPIDVEAEDVFVEAVLGSLVVHDDAYVNDPTVAWRLRRMAWLQSSHAKRLNKANVMPLGIDDGEEW